MNVHTRQCFKAVTHFSFHTMQCSTQGHNIKNGTAQPAFLSTEKRLTHTHAHTPPCVVLLWCTHTSPASPLVSLCGERGVCVCVISEEKHSSSFKSFSSVIGTWHRYGCYGYLPFHICAPCDLQHCSKTCLRCPETRS